jgi:hypothetical protein
VAIGGEPVRAARGADGFQVFQQRHVVLETPFKRGKRRPNDGQGGFAPRKVLSAVPHPPFQIVDVTSSFVLQSDDRIHAPS